MTQLFQVMAKPSGPSCNLRCNYCFYTEKESLYGNADRFRMSEEVLESFISQYIASQNSPEIPFAWQGGEPTLLGLDYFKSVVALQQKYAGGKTITNSIQTNGTLLTEEWCRFLKDHDFLVGLSIDGPPELHDRYRVAANGKPSSEAVLSGLSLLKSHGVAFNTLTVVNRHNADHPLPVYRFLKDIGDGHMQFIPAVERQADPAARKLRLQLALPPHGGESISNESVTSWSVAPTQLATFYTSIFDEWVGNDVGQVFIQFFDVALGNWLGAGSGLCQFAPTCGMAGALEHNGDLYACDHYVYPRHKLGNILETPLETLMATEKQQEFGRTKLDSLPPCCLACEVRTACHGDCPKHRFVGTAEADKAVSYLCPAYKQIYSHMAPYLGAMAQLIKAGRPASEVMTIRNSGTGNLHPSSPGRKEPCPCGSGKKYKRCCGANPR